MGSAGRSYVPINCERAFFFIVPSIDPIRTYEPYRKKKQNGGRRREVILFLSLEEDYFVQYDLQHFILAVTGMFLLIFHNNVFKNHCSKKQNVLWISVKFQMCYCKNITYFSFRKLINMV